MQSHSEALGLGLQQMSLLQAGVRGEVIQPIRVCLVVVFWWLLHSPHTRMHMCTAV